MHCTDMTGWKVSDTTNYEAMILNGILCGIYMYYIICIIRVGGADISSMFNRTYMQIFFICDEKLHEKWSYFDK